MHLHAHADAYAHAYAYDECSNGAPSHATLQKKTRTRTHKLRWVHWFSLPLSQCVFRTFQFGADVSPIRRAQLLSA